MGRLSAKDSELIALETERKNKLRKYSNDTFEDAIEKLNVYGICNMVRPTGFGKSYNLARITSYKKDNGEYKYNKCLYLYPLNVIKTDIDNKYGENGNSDVRLHNTEFCSYSLLNIKRKNGELLDYIKQFDLIMCDECHLCGSEGFLACYKEFKGLIGKHNIHIIGVTASPNRMDNFNVMDELFGGRKCSVFELSSAMLYAEGIMKEPKWLVGIYDKKEYVKNTSDFIVNNYKMQGSDKAIVRKVKNVEGTDILIKEVLKKYRPGQKYFKFICFYVDKADLLDKADMVNGWFESIFKKMKVNPLYLVSTNFDDEDTSVNNENGKKISKIADITKLKEEKGRIDIIHCIDMLNMGYHVDDIDGIIMLRNTRSEVIQIQQIGRCQSVTSTKNPLIFDLVNNYFTKKWFKGDTSKKESEYNLNSAVIDGKLARVYTDDGVEVVMTKGYLANILFTEELKNTAHLRRDTDAERMVFWYTEMKAPMYVLAVQNDGKSLSELAEQLKANGVYVEDESEYAKSLSTLDKKRVALAIRKLENKKNIFYLEKE